VELEVFTAVTEKNVVIWDVARVGLIQTDVSEDRVASNIHGRRNKRKRKIVGRSLSDLNCPEVGGDAAPHLLALVFVVPL
jgi:hypothetical protein